MNCPAPPYSFLIVYEPPSDCISLYTQHFRHSLEPFPTQRGYRLFGSGEKQSAFPEQLEGAFGNAFPIALPIGIVFT